MTALAYAPSLYGQHGLGLKLPRAQEYDVIARITSRLKSAEATLPHGFPQLAEALAENRQLWITLATDVSLPENSLPVTLKVQILNLAQFTLNHTARVLQGTEECSVLVDINLAILKGLSGKGGVE
jgi:flagellar biosynthesis activator protein FlaF